MRDSLIKSLKLSTDPDAPDEVLEPEHLDALVDQIINEDPPTRFFGIQSLRHRLTDDCEIFSFGKFVKTGAFGVIVKGLSCEETPDMQYECAWVLNNLMSRHGLQKADLLAKSEMLCQPLVKLLAKAPDLIRETACLALAPFVGKSAELRDKALGCELIPAIIGLLASKSSTEVLDATALLLVNLFRKQQLRINFEAAKTLLPHMVKLLDDPHSPVARQVVFALSDMMNSKRRIRLVLQEDILNHLRRYLAVRDEGLLEPTLRVFIIISSKMNRLPSCVLADGLLVLMRPLLDHPDSWIRREVLCFLSNISDGPDSNLQQIVDAGYLPKLGATLVEAEETKVRQAFCIVDRLFSTKRNKFKKLITDSFLEGFLEVLTLGDPELTNRVLLTVRELLLGAIQHAKWGLDFESLRKKIEQCGGLRKIKLVQRMGDEELAEMSHQIIEDFFWNRGQKYRYPHDDKENM